MDEDVEAGRDEDGGCEAEEENENQVVHQERLRRDPEVHAIGSNLRILYL